VLWRLGPTGQAVAAVPGGTLDPNTIPKYETPLVIPPAMPLTTTIRNNKIDTTSIAVVEFPPHILPQSMGLPRTTVWSYQLRNTQETRNYPAFTVEAIAERPVRVGWINGLAPQPRPFSKTPIFGRRKRGSFRPGLTAWACRDSATPAAVPGTRGGLPDADPHVRWCGRGRGDPGPTDRPASGSARRQDASSRTRLPRRGSGARKVSSPLANQR
jgi:hypothetical protein